MAKAQTGYSNKDLEEFKGIIDGKLKMVQEELKEMMDSFNSIVADNENEKWNMDEGNATSDTEFYSSQISRLDKYRIQLESALIRIENKSYGICTVTEKLIDKKRLLAVPTTTQSMEAKMKDSL